MSLIVTRGYGSDQMIVTRGYGLFVEPVVQFIKITAIRVVEYITQRLGVRDSV